VRKRIRSRASGDERLLLRDAALDLGEIVDHVDRGRVTVRFETPVCRAT
jgi:hypothetical protein